MSHTTEVGIAVKSTNFYNAYNDLKILISSYFPSIYLYISILVLFKRIFLLYDLSKFQIRLITVQIMCSNRIRKDSRNVIFK